MSSRREASDVGDGVEPIGHPQVGVDLEGDAVVVFEMTAPGETRPGIYAAENTNVVVWGMPVLLERMTYRWTVRGAVND